MSPWKAVALPPEQALLAGLVGHFTTKVHIYDDTIVRAKDSEGVADGKALIGGLFVQVTHSEPRNKAPFEGMVLLGFDTGTRKYTADAISQTSTAITHYVGSYDTGKKTLSLTSRYNDPASKLLTTARIEMTFVDAKTWTYDAFIANGVGAKEKKTVSVEFMRPEPETAGRGETAAPAAPPVAKRD